MKDLSCVSSLCVRLFVAQVKFLKFAEILSAVTRIATPAERPECFKVYPQACRDWTTKRENPQENGTPIQYVASLIFLICEFEVVYSSVEQSIMDNGQ